MRPGIYLQNDILITKSKPKNLMESIPIDPMKSSQSCRPGQIEGHIFVIIVPFGSFADN
jgi:hypothetical protein